MIRLINNLIVIFKSHKIRYFLNKKKSCFIITLCVRDVYSIYIIQTMLNEFLHGNRL